jgi:PST family polysaccharide transporter
MHKQSSYHQILKSSSLMGGVAIITLLLGLVRTKFAAIWIGVTGVGLLANFLALQGFASTLAGFGIQSSAVRDIAACVENNDQEKISRVVLSLHRICRITGVTGFCLMTVLSPFISRWTFGTDAYVPDIILLGVVILLTNLTGAHLALIQGLRRMRELAQVNIIGALLGSISSVLCYIYLGNRGIVPAMALFAAMNLIVSYRFSSRIVILFVPMTWRASFREVIGMLQLGVVFMSTALITAFVGYITSILITHQVSLQALGIYSAAFSLSSISVNFVLSAMGSDYYPRLVGISHDKVAMSRLVNEQLEVGLLLSAPIFLMLIVFAPFIVQILYSKDFALAANLMPWFLLGCLGRVISWPLGFVMLAMAKTRLLFVTELLSNIVHILLIILGLHLFGLVGVAYAFFSLYILHAFSAHYISRKLIGFQLSHQNMIIIFLLLIILILLFVIKTLPFSEACLFSLVPIVFFSIYALHNLNKSANIFCKNRNIEIKSNFDVLEK